MVADHRHLGFACSVSQMPRVGLMSRRGSDLRDLMINLAAARTAASRSSGVSIWRWLLDVAYVWLNPLAASRYRTPRQVIGQFV